MKRLTDDQVEQLREGCATVAHLNWDGGCTIEQRDDGTLCIKMLNEDEEVESAAFAQYEGELNDRAVWSLWLEAEQPHEGALITLVPVLIVGYMSLM